MTDEAPFLCASVSCLDDRVVLKVVSDKGAEACFSGIGWGVVFARNPKATPIEYPDGVDKPSPKTASDGYNIYDKYRIYPEFIHDDCLIILARDNKLWEGLKHVFLEYNSRIIDSKDVENLNWRCFKLTGIPDHVYWF